MSSSFKRTLLLPEVVREVVRRLQHCGHGAFVVGGAVRDLWRGTPPRDWDVATSASILEIRRLFPRVIPTGVRFGTVTVKIGDQRIEVSTFRGAGIAEDLHHRDFTLNAMALDPFRGRLVDPHGGIRDLECGRLRAVLRPRDRFREDPLRILRGIRLSVEEGLYIEPRTWSAMREEAAGLSRVAVERIREELNRILLCPSPRAGFERLRDGGILDIVIPELSLPRVGMDREGPPPLADPLAVVERLPAELHLRWAGLLHAVGLPLVARQIKGKRRYPGLSQASARTALLILERLRFSSRSAARISCFIRWQHIPLTPRWTAPSVRRIADLLGSEVMECMPLFWRALLEARSMDHLLGQAEEISRRIIDEIQRGKDRPLPSILKGEEILSLLNLKPGPLVGTVKRALRLRFLEYPSQTGAELSRWLVGRYLPKTHPELTPEGIKNREDNTAVPTFRARNSITS